MGLRDLDPDGHLRDPARKQAYVSAVFDTVAPSYDRFTTLFSFGMDARWKRQLGAWVAEVLAPGDVVVDLACGTGDVLEHVSRALASGGAEPQMMVGLDPNAPMLRRARERLDPAARPRLRMLRADMMALPIADRSVAAVTVAYGFRNVPDARAALAEVARVVRPGGWLFDLDFFRPERPGWRRLYLWYLRAAGRAAGRWWHREAETYGYLGRSLERWLTPPQFRFLLEDTGFRVEGVVRHLGGGICLHRARRVDGGAAF